MDADEEDEGRRSRRPHFDDAESEEQLWSAETEDATRQRRRPNRSRSISPTDTTRRTPRVRHDDAYELDFEDVFDDTFTVDSSRQRSVRP